MPPTYDTIFLHHDALLAAGKAEVLDTEARNLSWSPGLIIWSSMRHMLGGGMPRSAQQSKNVLSSGFVGACTHAPYRSMKTSEMDLWLLSCGWLHSQATKRVASAAHEMMPAIGLCGFCYSPRQIMGCSSKKIQISSRISGSVGLPPSCFPQTSGDRVFEDLQGPVKDSDYCDEINFC